MARIAPGSQWVLRRGVHSGTVIEVEGQSFAGSVKYRVIEKGDNTGSSREDDDGRVHSKPRNEFLTLYQPKPRGGGPIMTQSAFRQHNARRGQADPEAEVQQILSAAKNGVYKQGDLGVAIETITPEMAQTWLERGGANRRLNERRVLRLVMAIEIGEWQLTGDSIKLDKDGKVRDGQHRLTAIVRARTDVQALVVRGVSEAAFDVIDTGKNRNASDILAIHGHTSTTSKATCARGLIIIERTGRYANVGSSQTLIMPSNASILAYVEAHPEIIEAVSLADKLRLSGGFVGGSGLWAIAFCMFLRKSPDQARVFCNHLIEGAGLERGNPILKIRNMYAGKVRSWQSSNDSRERLLATVIKGWNAWRADENVQILSWHDTGRSAEKFPVAE